MAITLQVETDQSIDLNEFVEYIDRKVDRNKFADLLEVGQLLKMLANNRQFLIQHVNNQLLNWPCDPPTDVGDTSLCLARRDLLRLRANVWRPAADMTRSSVWQASMAAYHVPHDHNFSFVTVGYFGPGYETTIYEYDPRSIKGVPGEQIAITYLERTRLTQGKVMVYRCSRDIHYQEHPPALSVSLNLVVLSRKPNKQYLFDVQRSSILGCTEAFLQPKRLLCSMAAVLGDGRTSNVLEQVATTHPDGEVRLAAFSAWAQLECAQAAAIWRQALLDRHEPVRAEAASALARLE